MIDGTAVPNVISGGCELKLLAEWLLSASIWVGGVCVWIKAARDLIFFFHELQLAAAQWSAVSPQNQQLALTSSATFDAVCR